MWSGTLKEPSMRLDECAENRRRDTIVWYSLDLEASLFELTANSEGIKI